MFFLIEDIKDSSQLNSLIIRPGALESPALKNHLIFLEKIEQKNRKPKEKITIVIQCPD